MANQISRKRFLEISVAFVAAGTVGCGSDDEGDLCEGSGVDADIDGNHSTSAGAHSLSVPVADVMAGESQTYSIQGGSMHEHTIKINGPNFEKLANGETVITASSDFSNHHHEVQLRCYG